MVYRVCRFHRVYGVCRVYGVYGVSCLRSIEHAPPEKLSHRDSTDQTALPLK